MVVLSEPCGWRRCDARTWQSGSPRRPSLKSALKDYSPSRVARATCDKPLQRSVSTPNIIRKRVEEGDNEEDPEVISFDAPGLFPKRAVNVTFQETVEVYHYEAVESELQRRLSKRSLEDANINQRVLDIACNHEKIVAQMSECYSFLRSWITPQFGTIQ
eukprot:CAMPEP_0114667994 /NCGR_PEP_ID=MMETSP0191-20121206/35544_1 /TAXON_ID=126664 /ORGANISM="Sorites sp." /LENGTH=159 /DNA_ID=CAMNT_0001920053 /DNA_START=104 /DNA_END=583 /DNA_ORIENTATION=+